MGKEKQLSFDEVMYPLPDAIKPGIATTPVREKRPARKSKPAPPSSPQAFLPGLSRRGRPRSKNPISPSVRATESRKRRIDAGGKRIELLLEPAIASALELLADHYKLSRSEIIGRLIGKAAKRLAVKK